MKLQVNIEDLSKTKVYLDEESFVEVKPITTDEYAIVSSLYEKKGKISEADQVKLAFDVLERTIIGWGNIQDTEGREIPFSKELVKSFLSALLSQNEEAFQKIFKKAMTLVNKVEEEKKK